MINIDDQEISKVFDRYIVKRYEANDPELLGQVRDIEKQTARFLLKTRLMPFKRRTQRGIEGGYNISWSRPISDLLEDLGSALHMWGEDFMLCDRIGPKRVHLLYLMKAIEVIQPATIAEIGSGNGANLHTLSCMFPDISLTGAELTAAGVGAARKLQESEEVAKEIQNFCPGDVLSKTAHKNISFHQANAKSLPFGDDEFDLVFTILALEQMQEIRDEALSEIYRITKKYAAFAEPFNDFNKSECRDSYKRSKNYFDLNLSQLKNYGFEPIFSTGNFPAKYNLGVGFVIAQKG